MAKLSVQTVKEKAGKSEVTAEEPEFQALVVSMKTTKVAFENLVKIGRSVYQMENARLKKANDGSSPHVPVKNPAQAFLRNDEKDDNGETPLSIKKVCDLHVEYQRRRIEMDTARDSARKKAAAAENPGKDRDKKAAAAETAKKEEEKRTELYSAGKEEFEKKMEELHAARDNEFQKSVSAMCAILQNLKPDWQNNGGVNVPGEVVVEDEKVAENPDVDGSGGNPPAQMKAGTDSESD